MLSNDVLQDRYSLVKGAVCRARQLQSGMPPLCESKSLKACRVAQDEVRAGKVTFSLPTRKAAPPLDS